MNNNTPHPRPSAQDAEPLCRVLEAIVLCLESVLFSASPLRAWCHRLFGAWAAPLLGPLGQMRHGLLRLIAQLRAGTLPPAPPIRPRQHTQARTPSTLTPSTGHPARRASQPRALRNPIAAPPAQAPGHPIPARAPSVPVPPRTPTLRRPPPWPPPPASPRHRSPTHTLFVANKKQLASPLADPAGLPHSRANHRRRP